MVTVGASVSAADTAVSLIDEAQTPIYAVTRGKYNPFFGDHAFKHPKIKESPPISHISSENGERTVHFEDGTSASDVDYIILGTGFSWTVPFLPDVQTRNNRVPDLYLNVFPRWDPSLAFVGMVRTLSPSDFFRGQQAKQKQTTGLTFKVFEWQAVAAARVLSGNTQLPPLEEQQRWEEERISRKGDGGAFTLIHPEFEEYFEDLRRVAGEPGEGKPGRKLPPFQQEWVNDFWDGNESRVRMWKKANELGIRL